MEGSEPNESPKRPSPLAGTPFTIGLVLLLIGLWGCLSIYNAKAFGEFPLHFAGRQLGWLSLGLAFFMVAAKIPFAFYRSFAFIGAALAFASLLAVLEFGVCVNGMRGWFPLPCGLAMLQPSEFAKVPFLLFMSVVAADSKASWRSRFLKMGLAALAFVGVIALEPDFGVASMFFIGFLLIYWLAGGELLWGVLSLSIFAGIGALFLLRNDYAIARLVGYFNPDADVLGYGWHIKQFQYTMAHGGLFGANWGNALWSNAFLPLPHSDSVFASIVESTGFAGGLLTIGGFCALAIAACVLSKRAKAPDAKLYVFGVGAFLSVQALIHISVNATLLPPTGMTLPILSYGGSSLLSTMMAFGVALSALREKTLPATTDSGSASKKDAV